MLFIFYLNFSKLDEIEKRWREVRQRRLEKDERRRMRKQLKRSIEDSEDECLIIDEPIETVSELLVDQNREILQSWANLQVNCFYLVTLKQAQNGVSNFFDSVLVHFLKASH